MLPEKVAPVQGWSDLIIGETRTEVLRALRTAQRRGEVGAVGKLVRVDNMWAIRVQRLREPARERRWVKPVVVFGVAVAGVAGLGVGAWLAFRAVTQAVSTVSVAAVVGVLAVVVVVLLAGRGSGSGGCTFTVTHRH